MNKNIVLNALARVMEFMEKEDLPLYGKAFAWAVVALTVAAAFWLVCDGLVKLL